MAKANWNKRYSLIKQGGGFIAGRSPQKVNKPLKADNSPKEDKKEKGLEDLTIAELKEKLQRKKLEEELKKKGWKQSREHDESMLGVCHTCHVPVYYGEPLHKLQTHDSESSHSGWYGGARDGAGMFERGTSTHGGVYGGKNRSHSVLEGWIQCGFCYGSWKEEIEALKKWESGWKIWGAIIGVPFAIIGGGMAFFYGGKEQNLLGGILLWGFASYCLFAFIGGMIWRWKRGKKPEPDRYKQRKNPYRDTLVWKLDNEGKPVKEGSMKVNKYGMILDPKRDKELKTSWKEKK